MVDWLINRSIIAHFGYGLKSKFSQKLRTLIHQYCWNRDIDCIVASGIMWEKNFWPLNPRKMIYIAFLITTKNTFFFLNSFFALPSLIIYELDLFDNQFLTNRVTFKSIYFYFDSSMHDNIITSYLLMTIWIIQKFVLRKTCIIHDIRSHACNKSIMNFDQRKIK